ncbi:S9 family peptidase [Singulisphaera acidiphila]|uniref:Dipeptidyl aminopeptidase/acylaminoacyl peptidase n=1 Tax=Singulisphaera acidiphila (strain ATCC BAA-1392 / DSM 18658 / VKM B-2454 / MOB10) TaxID=886293 RepID=L0DQB5_SINAD|nr:S9 family peptidase [Singulisphaera acidiphila]AGA31055.1 dipeptidyl aminopeptidase/acylaminoacyl peptidase [Singulisphaera acidiphila DSM 18658]
MSRFVLERVMRGVVAIAFVVAWVGPSTVAHAQGTKEDYARADGLRERTRDKVFKARVEPTWFAEGNRFWYRNTLPAGAREFIVVDATEGTRLPAFDHVKLADTLTRVTGTMRKPTHLPFDRITFPKPGSIAFEVDGKAWRYDVEADRLEPSEPLGTSPSPDRRTDRRSGEGGGRRGARSARSQDSPDGKWRVELKGPDLRLKEKASGEEFTLSEGGTNENGYEAGVFWSPDSKRLVALRRSKGDERTVHLIESAPKDQLQPKLHSFDYLKPGDKPSVAWPHLFDVATRKEIAVGDDLFKNPWSLDDFHWSRDSSRFTFLYNQRGHQVLRLVSVDAETGATRAIIDEKNETFIDYSQKMFLRYLDETNEILWMSERDGWNHLYLVDALTGQVKNQVTRGEWVVLGIDRVDEEAREVWFRAGGIHSNQDPYFVHYARVNFDGSGLVTLTEGDGTHRVNFSPDRKWLVDIWSRVDLPPVSELRSAKDGKLLLELEKGDWSALLETGWRVPERFVAKGRDGKTEIHGVIFRPSNFDPRRTYPVIEQIYAGPQGAFVPKEFAALHRPQSLAELGFIVVQVDGMGTNWRSKAFHDVCWKNLGDAGFPDRILWMKAAAEKDPALDLSHVGIYGGSAGGQNAMGALLFHPEFYKVAVADCGCHDNRMDKIWWNEAWMGWPIGPEYADQSNVTNANKLRGKLLLFVGELDRNVDPASTMQVVNALIQAKKDFDFVVFPGAGHGAGGSPYGERRQRDFFVRHLLKVEPPDRNGE